MTDQELLMSYRKHSSAALTTEQFAALDYIPRSVLVAKRAMDIVVALIGLVVTAPLWPLVALAIRLDSPGPVIYRQMRVGRILADRTELFMILKFRSMRADAEKGTGAVWAQKHDPRITRVGAFIRKTRLDELPQLINVLRGDMSVVGPRPERVDMYLRLERAVPFYADRTAGLRPGITGLTQVVQGYDTTIEDVRRKVGFDAAYAMRLATFRGWLVSDVTIMLRTFVVMATGRGQ
jgi:lipopolysaccharide/colanic/teichoic acid biosynthesis glycosyltransferase